jgi:hypothetical protein
MRSCVGHGLLTKDLNLPSSESSFGFSRDLQHISILYSILEALILQYNVLASPSTSPQLFIVPIITSHNAVPQHRLSSRPCSSVGFPRIRVMYLSTNSNTAVLLLSFTVKLSALPTVVTTPSVEQPGAQATTGR